MELLCTSVFSGPGWGYLVVSSGQGIKILLNAGQEHGKGLEEPVVHTHQILWRVPPPHPSPSLYQNSTKCRSGTG